MGRRTLLAGLGSGIILCGIATRARARTLPPRLPLHQTASASRPGQPLPVMPNNAQLSVKNAPFNARGDGVTDDTAAIQKAIQAAQAAGQGTLYFPPGTYLVTQLNLASNTSLAGSPSAMLKTVARQGSIFAGHAVQNITISGLGFLAPGANVAAISLTRASHILIKNCRATGATLVDVEGSGAYQDTTSEAQLSDHITVAQNTCDGRNSDGKAGILLAYCRDCAVYGNHLQGYPHGIQWWGGDSNPARDGALAAPRWARRIQIYQNTILNTTSGGGIWGSMGQQVFVHHNDVRNCGDVGIDFEGCFSSQATYNRVHNCANGGITTFFFNKAILIAYNTATTTVAGQAVFKIYNASQGPDNRSIYVMANRFQGNGVLAQILSDAVDTLSFIRNLCINVSVNLNANNNRLAYIRNNRLLFSLAAGAPLTALSAGSHNHQGHVEITGNNISSSVQQPAGSIGIGDDEGDFNSSAYAFIAHNTVSGFPIDIQVANTSANPGITPTFLIQGNILGHATCQDNTANGHRANIHLSGNRDQAGKPVTQVQKPAGRSN